jgi:hypothetical protein
MYAAGRGIYVWVFDLREFESLADLVDGARFDKEVMQTLSIRTDYRGRVMPPVERALYVGG